MIVCGPVCLLMEIDLHGDRISKRRRRRRRRGRRRRRYTEYCPNNCHMPVAYLSIDQSREGEVIKQVGEVLPDVGVAVLSEALIIKSIHLSDLSALMIATEYCDPAGKPYLEEGRERERELRLLIVIIILKRTSSLCTCTCKLYKGYGNDDVMMM